MAYVAAVDAGTTGTRSIVIDDAGRVRGEAYRAHEQFYPEPGWVEHDPHELYGNARATLRSAIEAADVRPAALDAVGVATQRETTVLWERATGEPVHPAIVWQDRRTTDRIAALEGAGRTDAIRRTTGLEPDAYFSATKLEWLLERAADGGERSLRARARDGELCFGTVDAWLVWNLTGKHATDVTNASRTMLYDIEALAWDEALLAEFDVPRAVLPEVHASSHPDAYGRTDPDAFGAAVPVTGVLGDQQAALFGQACVEPGQAKSTIGTGSFLLTHTGTELVRSSHGLLTTLAAQRAGEPAQYALEGAVFVTGAAVEWLVDLGLAADPAAVEALARDVDGTDDVYVVPAFQGLGAPHWDGRARGTVVGLTRGTGRGHLARAVLEAIAYRTREVAEAMVDDSGLAIESLRVDGGGAANDLLCRLQADALSTPVVRPAVTETTALGAAYAAGLAVDTWDSMDDLREHWRVDATFEPRDDSDLAARYDRWRAAVERAREWAPE